MVQGVSRYRCPSSAPSVSTTQFLLGCGCGQSLDECRMPVSSLRAVLLVLLARGLWAWGGQSHCWPRASRLTVLLPVMGLVALLPVVPRRPVARRQLEGAFISNHSDVQYYISVRCAAVMSHSHTLQSDPPHKPSPSDAILVLVMLPMSLLEQHACVPVCAACPGRRPPDSLPVAFALASG